MAETLQDLRREIDETDDALHALIMRRAELAERVGRVKAESGEKQVFRPVRETQILRRLLGNHKGKLSKAVIIRLWRELISACTNLQSPMTAAVFMPERGMGNLELTRAYFGAFTTLLPCKSVNLVLKELTQGEADFAVLSLQDDQSCWWYALAQERRRAVAVFAKLPITGTTDDGRVVFALGKVPFESSGDDRTLLVVETDGSISLGTLDLVLKAGGIATNAIYDSFAPDMTRKAYLFEVDGFMESDDARLTAVVEKEDGKITMTRVIGGFPTPFV